MPHLNSKIKCEVMLIMYYHLSWVAHPEMLIMTTLTTGKTKFYSKFKKIMMKEVYFSVNKPAIEL